MLRRKRQHKPIETKIYPGDEARTKRTERVRTRLGLSNVSELHRSLVDRAAEALGVYHEETAAPALPEAFFAAATPPAKRRS